MRKGRPNPKTKRQPTFIRSWRKHRNLTLEQLSERLLVECEIELSDGQISRIERAESPYNQDVLEALAMVLTTTPSDLINRDPAKADSISSIWDTLAPTERKQAEKIILAIRGTGTDG